MANVRATEVFFVVSGKGLSKPSSFRYSWNPMHSAPKRTVISAGFKFSQILVFFMPLFSSQEWKNESMFQLPRVPGNKHICYSLSLKWSYFLKVSLHDLSCKAPWVLLFPPTQQQLNKNVCPLPSVLEHAACHYFGCQKEFQNMPVLM